MSNIVVVGGDYCPYCIKVKKYFQQTNLPFEYIDVKTEDGADKRAKLGKKHHWKTIPMVFINDQFIGGCDDFFNAVKKGEVKL